MIGPTSIEGIYHAAYSKNKFTASSVPTPAVSENTAVGADQICISPAGSLQQAAARATAAAGALPAVPQSRLDALRDKISAGQYTVPAANIADSMLNRGLLTTEAVQ